MTNFILRDPKVVFIHLPKTGGTSVRKALGKSEGRFFGHIPREFRDRPSFSIVREPTARFLSAFRMFKYGNALTGDYYSKPRMPDLTISEALDILEDPWIGLDRSQRTLPWNLKHHMIPQTHPFNCLTFAKSILRLENIEEEFANFAADLDLDCKLPKLRSSRGKQQDDEHWEVHDRERFHELFKADFDELGYALGGWRNWSQSSSGRSKNEEPQGTNVYEIWSAYFSDKKILIDDANAALPNEDCDLEALVDEVIPGKGKVKAWAGRSKNLIDHFRQLQPEFAGASRLSHLLACLIVVLRRDATNTHAYRLFWRIMDEQFDVIRCELSLRWLVSVADTISDFGRSSGERAVGMSASIYANTAKLHESELKVFYPKRPWPPKKRLSAGGELFDGMITYWVEKGDLIDNMFVRSEQVAETEPVAGKVLKEVIERLKQGPTVYRRFNQISGKKAVPLLDVDTKNRIQRIVKKNL